MSETDTDKTIIQPSTYSPQGKGKKKTVRFRIWPILIFILGAAVSWFIFTAKPVQILLEPTDGTFEIKGGISFPLGDITLVRPGSYDLLGNLEGYYPMSEKLEISNDGNQQHQFTFKPLPGKVSIYSNPIDATVEIEENSIYRSLGTTPISNELLDAGIQTLRFSKKRYQPTVSKISVVGKNELQEFSVNLKPNWAIVTITSSPKNATVYIDDVPTKQKTPAEIEIIDGEHEISLVLNGYKTIRQKVLVEAMKPLKMAHQKLTRADATLTIESDTPDTSLTINGKFVGIAPKTITVKSNEPQEIKTFKPGFNSITKVTLLDPGEHRTLNITPPQQMGTLSILTIPKDASIYVNGLLRGKGDRLLRLPTVEQIVELQMEGYAGYKTTITPRDGMTQVLKVRLLTEDEARMAAMKPSMVLPEGHEITLITPNRFQMGTSRREAGRRANEVQRNVEMERMFYIGKREVSNQQFAKFAQGHDSGIFQERKMNQNNQPVVNISWEEAALYCNWLSERNNLTKFYVTERGRIIGVNSKSTGYRLPTEAEWAWVASQSTENIKTRFPWGENLPPPARHGNYADQSASNLVGRVIFGYNDNHIVSSPVGTYPPDLNGIFDMAGNVAEWVNDFYEVPNGTEKKDPLGPDKGEYHVIRGSSWMHGTITDLRTTFRDYGRQGRKDIGFRIARYAE